MYQATKATQQERYLAADVTALYRECEQIEENLMRALAVLGALENAAQVILDYRDLSTPDFFAKYPGGFTWDEVAANTRKAILAARAVMKEVEAGK